MSDQDKSAIIACLMAGLLVVGYMAGNFAITIERQRNEIDRLKIVLGCEAWINDQSMNAHICVMKPDTKD